MNTMINMILIFPIIACLLVLIIKNKTFNTWMVNLYAVLHFVITVLLASGHGAKNGIPYFAVDISDYFICSIFNGCNL